MEHNYLAEKAHLIVEVYRNISGVEYDEYTQELESMIRVALGKTRDRYKPVLGLHRRRELVDWKE